MNNVTKECVMLERADTIITALTAFSNQPLERGKSLIFFDEIQECPRARTAIKFLVENGRFDYMVVGGMPAVVQNFIDSHDVAKSVQLQRDILTLYRQYITKYSKNDKNRIKDIFDRIPSELNSKNHRFMLSDIDKNARMNRYESNFVWLSHAGVTLPCYNVRKPVAPFELNELRNLMKLFLNDTGLLCAMSAGYVQFDILQGNIEVNLGSVLENLMAQELAAHGFSLRYFDRKNLGELDFIVQKGNDTRALEIKSGKDYHRHAALDNVIVNKAWKLHQGLVFCMATLRLPEKLHTFHCI